LQEPEDGDKMKKPEQSAIAKAAKRLLPFLCLRYIVNFLDRVNVGFAALAMNQDLGFTPTIFGTGADRRPTPRTAS
jgi:ACS family tartrate transporter-like MFS transporter